MRQGPESRQPRRPLPDAVVTSARRLRSEDVQIETLFLDAGGVLVFPNWDRVAATLTRHGLPVTGDALREVEPPVKFSIDEARRVASSNDADRGSMYVEAVLDRAGIPRVPENAFPSLTY